MRIGISTKPTLPNISMVTPSVNFDCIAIPACGFLGCQLSIERVGTKHASCIGYDATFSCERCLLHRLHNHQRDDTSSCTTVDCTALLIAYDAAIAKHEHSRWNCLLRTLSKP